jgi:hypothetical protein
MRRCVDCVRNTVGEVRFINYSDTDLKIIIYTVASGSEDATKLDLALAAGVH